MDDPYQVDFEPIGRRLEAQKDQTLLDIARAAGIGIASVCGGVSTCLECKIKLVSGELSPPTLEEQSTFSPEEISLGYRLACQAYPRDNVKIEIPPESMTSPQRLQLEGREDNITIDPIFSDPSAYGLAVDIGTTKVAAYLIKLSTGETVSRAGAMNPQIAYGEDVISRIAFAGREIGGGEILKSRISTCINQLLEKMTAEANIPISSVLDGVLVGNTAMHHIFAGLPVEQLGYAPFSPATTQALTIPAHQLGLSLGPGSSIYLPSVISGYIGSDHVSMLLSTEAWRSTLNVVALDIGTNTEISLVSGGRITCCSCASGPAFEGAHIHDGMRAAPGAIERARWSGGKIIWQSIDDLPPVGICGSGILEIIASFQDGKIVKSTGVMAPGYGSEVVIVPANQNGLDRDLVVTRKDVNEIQLAKSAIRVGVEILLQNSSLSYEDIDEFIVAGAFGTYLSIHSAIRTGMFPPLPNERFRQVGNAAGAGAKQMLVSLEKRKTAQEITDRIEYLELTTHPAFTQLYVKHLQFET